MSNTKRVNVVLTGKEKRYYEEQKARLGKIKDSQCLRALLNEHKAIAGMKY